MLARAHRQALRLYQRLPLLARRWIVRAIAPKYTVGAMVMVERADGRILLVRQSYKQRWGLPGGLLQRREDAAEAARRELREEVGLDVVLEGEPAVAVVPEPQRVDVIYRARPADPAAVRLVAPCSPEIDEVAWFDPEALPELQDETASALVTLARSARAPQTHPLPGPP